MPRVEEGKYHDYAIFPTSLEQSDSTSANGRAELPPPFVLFQSIDRVSFVLD
jgi:hypothetical protein